VIEKNLTNMLSGPEYARDKMRKMREYNIKTAQVHKKA
jgi:hypothetical protein